MNCDHVWQPFWTEQLGPESRSCRDCGEVRRAIGVALHDAEAWEWATVALFGGSCVAKPIACSGPCGTSTAVKPSSDIAAYLCGCCRDSNLSRHTLGSSSPDKVRKFNHEVASAWDRHVRGDSPAYRKWAAAVAMLVEHCNARPDPRLLKREDITQCGAEAMR